MKIVNIDEVLPKDKYFTLDGKTYTMPGSVPVRRMLNLMRYSQRLTADNNDADAFEGAINEVASIVAIKTSDFNREKFMDAMTPEAYQKIVETLYTQDKPEEETKNA